MQPNLARFEALPGCAVHFMPDLDAYSPMASALTSVVCVNLEEAGDPTKHSAEKLAKVLPWMIQRRPSWLESVRRQLTRGAIIFDVDETILDVRIDPSLKRHEQSLLEAPVLSILVELLDVGFHLCGITGNDLEQFHNRFTRFLVEVDLESVPKALCCGPSPWSLVPKPIPVLRPGQPTEHQLNHADPDLRLAGISQVFIILAVNPAPTQPAEGSLHHPPPRQQLKPSVPGKPADDLNHIPPVLRDPSVQGVIVVLGVRPQLPQARERFSRQLAEDLRCRRRIIHGRTGDGHG